MVTQDESKSFLITPETSPSWVSCYSRRVQIRSQVTGVYQVFRHSKHIQVELYVILGPDWVTTFKMSPSKVAWDKSELNLISLKSNLSFKLTETSPSQVSQVHLALSHLGWDQVLSHATGVELKLRLKLTDTGLFQNSRHSGQVRVKYQVTLDETSPCEVSHLYKKEQVSCYTQQVSVKSPVIKKSPRVSVHIIWNNKSSWANFKKTDWPPSVWCHWGNSRWGDGSPMLMRSMCSRTSWYSRRIPRAVLKRNSSPSRKNTSQTLHATSRGRGFV